MTLRLRELSDDRLRELSDDERAEVQRIARSHTLGAGMVRRAQIIVHAMSGLKAEEIATRMDLCGNTVRHWLNRFNARGLKGLEEDVRSGRPPTYSAEQRSAVITAALTRPADLGLPTWACRLGPADLGLPTWACPLPAGPWIAWWPISLNRASPCAAAGSARSSSERG
jgi:hypothetical protein